MTGGVIGTMAETVGHTVAETGTATIEGGIITRTDAEIAAVPAPILKAPGIHIPNGMTAGPTVRILEVTAGPTVRGLEVTARAPGRGLEVTARAPGRGLEVTARAPGRVMEITARGTARAIIYTTTRTCRTVYLQGKPK
jgi:hypothetical protein